MADTTKAKGKEKSEATIFVEKAEKYAKENYGNFKKIKYSDKSADYYDIATKSGAKIAPEKHAQIKSNIEAIKSKSTVNQQLEVWKQLNEVWVNNTKYLGENDKETMKAALNKINTVNEAEVFWKIEMKQIIASKPKIEQVPGAAYYEHFANEVDKIPNDKFALLGTANNHKWWLVYDVTLESGKKRLGITSEPKAEQQKGEDVGAASKLRTEPAAKTAVDEPTTAPPQKEVQITKDEPAATSTSKIETPTKREDVADDAQKTNDDKAAAPKTQEVVVAAKTEKEVTPSATDSDNKTSTKVEQTAPTTKVDDNVEQRAPTQKTDGKTTPAIGEEPKPVEKKTEHGPETPAAIGKRAPTEVVIDEVPSESEVDYKTLTDAETETFELPPLPPPAEGQLNFEGYNPEELAADNNATDEPAKKQTRLNRAVNGVVNLLRPTRAKQKRDIEHTQRQSKITKNRLWRIGVIKEETEPN